MATLKRGCVWGEDLQRHGILDWDWRSVAHDIPEPPEEQNPHRREYVTETRGACENRAILRDLRYRGPASRSGAQDLTVKGCRGEASRVPPGEKALGCFF
jgi:hypothetical protein